MAFNVGKHGYLGKEIQRNRDIAVEIEYIETKKDKGDIDPQIIRLSAKIACEGFLSLNGFIELL